ncbi:MAG: hypothetical protein IMW89_16775 [Ktedonobacteraceae bacterium]|nr:hypothetical protein [Ktedonobacteraceae bacterium]
MEEKVSGSNVAAQQQQPASQQSSLAPSSELTGTEHRVAYGTAKTENLRDSGLWRILLPGLVVIFCLALLAFPLAVLIPLLSNSIAALGPGGDPKEAGLLWVWIVMAVLEVGIAVVVIWGFYKIFLTQAINYEKH